MITVRGRLHSSGIVGRPGNSARFIVAASRAQVIISFLSYTTHPTDLSSAPTPQPVIGAFPFKVGLGTSITGIDGADASVKVASISRQHQEGQISAAEYILKVNMTENDATGVGNTNSANEEDAIRAPPRYPSSLHPRCGSYSLQHRTARLALPESHADSGDSEGDEEEEEEDSEEEDGDPLADFPDETEVHISPRRLLD